MCTEFCVRKYSSFFQNLSTFKLKKDWWMDGVKCIMIIWVVAEGRLKRLYEIAPQVSVATVLPVETNPIHTSPAPHTTTYQSTKHTPTTSFSELYDWKIRKLGVWCQYNPVAEFTLHNKLWSNISDCVFSMSVLNILKNVSKSVRMSGWFGFIFKSGHMQ